MEVISDPKAWRTAHLMVEQCKNPAAVDAAARCSTALEIGNRSNYEHGMRVLGAINDLHWSKLKNSTECVGFPSLTGWTAITALNRSLSGMSKGQ